jgi:hypothetical protein
MAISVDTVYKTVLLILNKEQRGYMTPDEFNKTATQVQREIFEKYFEDLNQQVRIPQTDMDYSDRVAVTDEKIAEFKREAVATSTAANIFTLPTDLYRLGSVTFEPANKLPVELQRIGRAEFYNIRKSPLTAPSTSYPIYLYEDNQLIVYPTSITGKVKVQYVKKPSDIIWAYFIDDAVGGTGAYYWDSSVSIPVGASGPYPATGSVNFELHNSEQTEVILNILMYAGVIIRNPQVIQAAAAKVQQDEVNEKS